MFFGTTPAIISQHLAKLFAKLKPEKIYVPFSGNFVIEQVVSKVSPDTKIIAGDVSLYSNALGFGLCEKDFRLELNPEYLDYMPFFDTLSTPIEKAAAVLYFTDVAQNLTKAKHKYYQDLLLHTRNNAESYFKKAVEKITKVKENLKNFEYFALDANITIENLQQGELIYYDPPYFTGDYEKMFAKLNDIFSYDKTPYGIIDSDKKIEHLEYFSKKGIKALFRTMDKIDIESYKMVFKFQYNYDKFYHLYTNFDTDSFIGRFEPLKSVNPKLPIINKNDVISEKSRIEIIPVPTTIGNHYRILWVGKARMTSGGNCYLIQIDSKVVGLLQIESPLAFGQSNAIIFSDPAAPTSRYKRLSKLILHLCCTETFLKVINERFLWPCEGFITRVFTNHEVSMKYRNLFEITTKEIDKDGNFKYRIMYKNKKLFIDYPTALNEWLKKDGKQLCE